MSDWLNTNKLVAHESKIKLILFTSRIHPVLPDIRFNKNSLELASYITYHGIILDDKLSFKLHTGDACRRFRKIRGVIYSVLGFINKKFLSTLYYSFVYSHLNQSIVIWGGASENSIRPVRCVVNKILRIFFHVWQDDHNIPEIGTHGLYITLSGLKLHDVYNYILLKFTRFPMNDRPELFE